MVQLIAFPQRQQGHPDSPDWFIPRLSGLSPGQLIRAERRLGARYGRTLPQIAKACPLPVIAIGSSAGGVPGGAG